MSYGLVDIQYTAEKNADMGLARAAELQNNRETSDRNRNDAKKQSTAINVGSGAATGAMIGSAFVPGVGTAVGAAVGAGVGFVASLF